MKDYGCDPIRDGRFKIIPSGDVVSKEEKNKRLPKKEMKNEILGMSWDELERKQGGKLKRK